MPLSLEIITPEKKAYADTVDEVAFTTSSGEIAVLPGHVPLLTELVAGVLRARKGGKVEDLAVARGFVRVLGDVVSVLTDAAIEVESIDTHAAEEAEKRAREALEEARRQKDVDAEELDRLEAMSRYAIAQLLAKRRRGE